MDPEIGPPAPTPPAPLAALLVISAATAILIRLGRGYLPFSLADGAPSVLLARTGIDPTLFPRDAMLLEPASHLPLWPWTIALGGLVAGIAPWLWLLTLVLSVWIVWGIGTLLTALGGSLHLLPVAALLILSGPAGRLVIPWYPESFGLEQVALGALLWSCSSLIRGRPLAAGLYLAFAAVTDARIAAAGAAGLLPALPFVEVRRRSAFLLGAVALVICVVPLPASPAAFQAVVTDGLLFRNPERFTLGWTSMLARVVLLVTVLSGILGALLLHRRRADLGGPAVAVLLGQVSIALAATLLYGHQVPAPASGSVEPYLVRLTAVIPLMVSLAIICAVSGAEEVIRPPRAQGAGRWLGLVLVIALAHLLLIGTWHPADLLLLGLAAAAAALVRVTGSGRPAVWLYGAAGLPGLVWLAVHDRKELPAPAETEAVLSWVRDSTTRDALFIVPPGMREFRIRSDRSVYVDFALFPGSEPRLIPEWRRRLELVAAPDRLARTSAGWRGVPYWDRTYANRNTPGRIAGLLRETGADYFVWDRQGLIVPPFVPVARPADSRVVRVFADRRFQVYRLARGER